MDASYIIYTGTPTTHIPIATNQALDVILRNIDTAINAMSAAPNYTGYNLYCVKQTDGTTHPTNTQNFAEGISKNLCDFHTAYNTFTGTTYVSDQAVITTAINDLQTPALTYSHNAGGVSISITSGMSRNQVLTAIYTAIGDIGDVLAAPGTTWSSWSITAPDNISDAFDAVITYGGALTTAVLAKQASLGTFNLSSIGFGSSVAPIATINDIVSYVADLPTFDPSGYTWYCVSSSSTLDGTLQNILNSIHSVANQSVTSGTSGQFTLTNNADCSGKNIALDTTNVGLYKVILSNGDTYANAGYLDSKLQSSDGSISMALGSHKIDLTVTNPANGKVKVNSSDTTSNYLSSKIASMTGDWGLAILATPNSDNTQLQLIPKIQNPTVFASNFMSYISDDEDLLAQFCALQTQCAGCTCAAPTGLSVSISGSNFVLAWTVGGSPVSQMSEYRQRGSADWITNVNISPANPETNIATTSTISNLDKNTVYQFQVESVCSGATNGSNMYESIIYNCQTLTTVVNAGVISVNQPMMSTVDTIQYQLLNGSNVVVNSQVATGLNPQATFTSQASGTYHIKWRYGTVINGVTLYSDDASQLNAYCTATGIVIS